MNAGRQLLRLGASVLPKQGKRDYVTLERVKELQKKFQKDDGLPVFLKDGKSDLILYRLVILMTIGSTAFTLKNIYTIGLQVPPTP